MDNLYNENICISKINTVVTVKKGMGNAKFSKRAFHGLVFYYGGSRLYRFEDGKEYRLCAGEILYLPKDSSYEAFIEQDGECIAINFLESSDNETYPPFIITPKNSVQFAGLFKSADKIWNSRGLGWQIKTMSVLYEIIFNIYASLNIPYRSTSDLKKLKPAFDYIGNNYCEENISIANLAKICKISEVYFRKIFKEIYKINPNRYINSLRIDKATELFDSGMYSIKEIALITGYEDESYFSRVYKRFTGLTPKSYKAKIDSIK
jgi:AraC-like DNA-binding protein